MASPTNFKISPGMPSGPTDLFLPIADSHFLKMLILMVKGLPESVDWIWGVFLSQLTTDA
jgi:hypothetical protein